MPRDGEMKYENGIRWRYEDPPGTWVAIPGNKPLEQIPKESFAVEEDAPKE